FPNVSVPVSVVSRLEITSRTSGVATKNSSAAAASSQMRLAGSNRRRRPSRLRCRVSPCTGRTCSRLMSSFLTRRSVAEGVAPLFLDLRQILLDVRQLGRDHLHVGERLGSRRR